MPRHRASKRSLRHGRANRRPAKTRTLLHVRPLPIAARSGACSHSVRVTADRLTFRLDIDSAIEPWTSPAALIARAGAITRASIGSELSECLVAVFVNVSGGIIGFTEVARGNDNLVVIRPRDVLRPALLVGAAGIIIAHNHPGGSTEPSEADVEVFSVLRDAAAIVGMNLMDSLVVTEHEAVSIRSLVPHLAEGAQPTPPPSSFVPRRLIP